MSFTQPVFLGKPLLDMSNSEWESICDGCGLCCQIRLEDIDTGNIILSNVSCRYLCHVTHYCKDYDNRQKNVPDCIKVTPSNIDELTWLPETCGYKLVNHKQPLPSWHHLICGDKEEVHRSGPSMKGELISEDDAEIDWENDL
jgi:uncharacterized cysteine cluster protein YcgN (CxxCxxCC family)